MYTKPFHEWFVGSLSHYAAKYAQMKEALEDEIGTMSLQDIIDINDDLDDGHERPSSDEFDLSIKTAMFLGGLGELLRAAMETDIPAPERVKLAEQLNALKAEHPLFAKFIDCSCLHDLHARLNADPEEEETPMERAAREHHAPPSAR